jgi:hypothetical protein
MAQTRFTCTLTKADEPSCPSYAAQLQQCFGQCGVLFA